MNKKVIKYFSGISLVLGIGLILVSIFYSRAFVPASMLILSLFTFSMCYYVKDDKKNIMYGLFILGILLVITAIIYTYLRLGLI